VGADIDRCAEMLRQPRLVEAVVAGIGSLN